jgi:D-serine deaminase-like pyridoxal phosphate-dependent protein
MLVPWNTATKVEAAAMASAAASNILWSADIGQRYSRQFLWLEHTPRHRSVVADAMSTPNQPMPLFDYRAFVNKPSRTVPIGI